MNCSTAKAINQQVQFWAVIELPSGHYEKWAVLGIDRESLTRETFLLGPEGIKTSSEVRVHAYTMVAPVEGEGW